MGDAYQDFLASKAIVASDAGFKAGKLSKHLYPFQEEIVRWALRLGRAAIFAECGLGKTLMQLEWANRVAKHTKGKVLLLAPLAVTGQTVAEAKRFGIDAAVSRDGTTSSPITVTNYQQLHKFNVADFAGVVLDESSILKTFSGTTKTLLIESFKDTPYKLACTATPAPNDHSELGNHSEFLGVMTGHRMLSRFFINDTTEMGSYRLKGHAEGAFWKWVASWAVCMGKPSDMDESYSDDGYILHPLDVRLETVAVPQRRIHEKGTLFAIGNLSATEIHGEMRQTAEDRAQRVADLVKAEPDESWTVWCNTNYEADALMAKLPAGAVEVRGGDSDEKKEDALLGFAAGAFKVLVTKPSIAGFGMNFQHCARVAFVGLSYSYEQLYQALRRSWRFGQTRAVHAYIVTAETEQGVLENVMGKQQDHAKMSRAMIAAMRGMRAGQQHTPKVGTMEITKGTDWEMRNGDCVEGVAQLPDNSVDFCIFSPPFANLYIYTDTGADMGNCDDDGHFIEHFRFLITSMHRVMRPGRLVAIHCKNLVNYAVTTGMAGIRDFRGDIIRAMCKEGFAFHSEVCIWKSPVTEMQRTKANGLLHKTIKRDASFSRMGLPDYLCVFRKWPKGDEQTELVRPVTHTAEAYPVELWQRVASPVWHDIDQTDVLNVQEARVSQDEKHICPLQLGVISRAVELWTNPGDVVMSPFAGIGSEGYESLKLGRKFIGFELKPEYYKKACTNLRNAVSQPSLFGGAAFETEQDSDANPDYEAAEGA